jgi:hypothetical protein
VTTTITLGQTLSWPTTSSVYDTDLIDRHPVSDVTHGHIGDLCAVEWASESQLPFLDRGMPGSPGLRSVSLGSSLSSQHALVAHARLSHASASRLRHLSGDGIGCLFTENIRLKEKCFTHQVGVPMSLSPCMLSMYVSHTWR